MHKNEGRSDKTMKIRILVIILIIAVIILGVLMGLKAFSKTAQIIAEGTESEGKVLEEEQIEKEIPKSKYDGTERTIAVSIDNVGDAIPQTSLNKAMLVYEMYVEGGLTRFLAVYKNEEIDTIGPVRSARPCFVDYALENDSIFVHYGGSQRAKDDIKKLGIQDVDGLVSSAFWRTKEKKAPHNALISTKNIWNEADKKNYRKTTTERNVLNYSIEEVNIEDETATVANTINIPYKTSKVKFVYNPETKLYERYVGDALRKDWLTGEALTTKNIIITFANNYTTSEDNSGRQEIENIGNLDGYYITNGKAIKIKCKKSARAERTVYNDLAGNEIKVNDGNTYIQIVPPSMSITME